MAFAAKILADSMAPSGKRLTTFEATYPRCIHSELMTHRMLSRNAASSRAIPVEKMIARVIEDPFVPIHWGQNQKGMQAEQELTPEQQLEARAIWLDARDVAVGNAHRLLEEGLHKQITNRLLEPWMWITVIVSATTWSNFFGLRCHKDAEPHFQKIAGMLRELFEASKPQELFAGEWHRPLWGFDGDVTEAYAIADATGTDVEEIACKISVGRVARVSYLTQDGRRDLREDITLHDRMMVARPLHASPAEHVAQALAEPIRVGNFVGWRQWRKRWPDEHIGEVMP